jgi:hypothetical protein
MLENPTGRKKRRKIKICRRIRRIVKKRRKGKICNGESDGEI